MTHKAPFLACLIAAGLALATTANAQEPKPRPAPPPRGEIRGEPDVPPPPRTGAPREDRPGEFGNPPRRPGMGPEGRGPFRGDVRRGADGRPVPDGPEGRPGMAPRGSFPGGPLGPGMLGGPAQDLRRLAQDDPEMYDLIMADSDLDRQAGEKAGQLRNATSETRDKLKAELAEIVGKHFEARQKRRELQLKRMEEEIQRLRDAIQARNDARDDIVNKRITELTGAANPLDF
jgi:hypothetical protein